MWFHTAETGTARCEGVRVDRDDDGALLSVREAVELVRISRGRLYRLARSGRLAGSRKIGGAWRFERRALLRWLACSPRGIASRRASP